MNWLQYKATDKDDEMGLLEELEAYLVMFQASIFQALEPKPEENCSQGFEATQNNNGPVGEEARTLESLFQESEELEDRSVHQEEENEANPLRSGLKSDAEMKDLESLFQEDESEFQDLVHQKEQNEESDKEKISGSRVNILESLFQEKEDSEDLVHQKENNEGKPQEKDSELRKYSEEEESKGKLGLRSGFRMMMGNNRNSDQQDSGLAQQTTPLQDSKLRSTFSANQCVEDSEELVHEKEESEGKPKQEEEEERKGRVGLRSGMKGMKLNSFSNNSKSQRVLEASLGSPENNWVYSESNYLGSFGSMRREKEWRRTLACKLFEERHSNNVNGSESEGMDSLWEAYETQSDSKKTKKVPAKKVMEDDEDEDDEDEDDEEGMEGKLCCLQALKFSAGKMNLGMGRPNLVKITKAFKGIGWFHHVGRHGRKG